MITHKYGIAAHGVFHSQKEMEKYTALLESKLNNGPDCLAAYAMFPSDSKILDHVSFSTTKDNVIAAVNLHTYTELYEGEDDNLVSCVRENMEAAAEELDRRFDDEKPVVDGVILKPVVEGKIPKTLYHIAEKDFTNIIQNEGIDPENGGHAYMNDRQTIYLCEKEQLATWLAVLKHNENPVIMEVQTDGLNISQGRVYEDRGFAPDGYVEYTTKEYIPPSAIKEAELTGKFCAELHNDMVKCFSYATSYAEDKEAMTGMERLDKMGILQNSVKFRAEILEERKNEAGVSITKEEFDEAFTKAIQALSVDDDSMQQ